MLANAYFGCGIAQFNEKTKQLKKMRGLPMIRKFGLDDNFSKKVLCTQKSCLGIGLIEPNTAIDVLSIKLRTGNKKLQENARNLTLVQEEISFIESGLTKRKKKKHKQKVLGWRMDRGIWM